MRRQWSTPVLWVVFTALATVVGLGSVSLVRHDVVATSLQPTSAADVSKVLGSAAPAPETTEPAGTEPSSTPSATPRPSASAQVHRTSSPAPVRSTPASRPTQRATQSPTPRPTSTVTTSRVFMQPFASAGWIEVRCTGSVTSLVAAAGNPPLYDNPEIGPSDGGFEFAFHPTRDGYPEIQGFVRCDAGGQAKWFLSGGSDH